MVGRHSDESKRFDSLQRLAPRPNRVPPAIRIEVFAKHSDTHSDASLRENRLSATGISPPAAASAKARRQRNGKKGPRVAEFRAEQLIRLAPFRSSAGFARRVSALAVGI
jgi:hypothetical protein